MKKKIISLGLIALIFVSNSILFAHEFWLMPAKFKAEIGELVALNFFVGEDFEGELWGKRKEKTLKLTHFFNKNEKNLTAAAIATDSNDIQMTFKTKGTHVVTMQTKNSFIALDAEKFNAYLKEDGIDDIYALRQKNGDLDKPSRELYRRCAKTIIQIGDKTDKTFKRNTGMELELMPLNNPYTLKDGDKMTVKVLFQGKPLVNKMVVTWRKSATVKTVHEKYYTDAKGNISFPLNQRGQWMVSTVQMIPLVNNPEGNYQSYWGNLTFGF